jgi:hypothetical protein
LRSGRKGVVVNAGARTQNIEINPMHR